MDPREPRPHPGQARTRPVIGITTYVEPVAWSAWQPLPAVLLPYTYVGMVRAAGGRAVLLPPDDQDAGVLERLDGLILAGGADIAAERYGALSGPLTEPRPDRDAGELTLLTAALAADLPVLGICRGMQLLAVAHGGTLDQHVPDTVGHEKHRPAPGVYGTHGVRFAPGSRIAEIMAGDTEVNTYHHQAVSDPGGLAVTAWADDGVIEAVEDPGRAFAVGVQWHPEEAADPRPFAALTEAAVLRTGAAG